MGRSPCCAKEGLNRGAWTAPEDMILSHYVKVHGAGGWKYLPKNAGLKRCGKSCRLRWLNYLRPDIKRGNFSEDEEELIVRLHKLLGNRWALIAGRIPGRTDNEIKNYWNTNLSKKAASLSPSLQMTTKNTKTVGPSSSSCQVFRTRATRCSKVVIQPQLPPPPTSNNVVKHDQNEVFVEKSVFNSEGDLPAEGGIMTDFTDFLDAEGDDDLGLGDFCLSEFLNTDHDDHFNDGTCTDQNHQPFSLFIDNDWDI